MKRTLYSELRTLYETSAADPHTFRITIKLKDIVDGGLLRKAVDTTMDRYPYFRVRIRADGNRLYFEDNPAPLPVLNTNRRIVLGGEQTSGHLMAFCFWKNRLYIDAYHGLTDGGGIAPLIKTLLYCYCSAFYDEKEFSTEGIRLSDSPVSPGEWEDPAEKPLPGGDPILVPKWSKPAFQIADGGIAAIIPECFVVNIRIPEAEFMRFNISNDGSPATIVSLLLARTIDALHPDACLPPVIAMCVNQRRALRAPLAHQSLVGNVRLPYTDRVRSLPFSTQATCFRGMVTLQSSDDMVRNEIKEYQELMTHLDTLGSHTERQSCCQRKMEELSRCVTATVSYVGKANLGDAERFIQEYEALPSTALPSTHVPLTVEMSAMNGYFFLNFIQYFRETDYLTMFIRQLRMNNIDYDVLNVTEARYPRVELPV
ncbi:MAG: hypothetical protein IJL71_03405 [Oscillospiraceae bacterium]|nr:hypothetical protein [Oscillospiraceae bacterium]